MQFRKIAVTLLTLGLITVPALAAEQTLKGVISDSMCGRKHMLPGKTDAQCIQECIKAKSKYALVTENKIYTLQGSTTDFEKLAGKQVQVSGDVDGTNLKVTKIGAAK